jgi:hypothetical protein
MKRVLTTLLLAAGLGLSAGRGEAQVTIQIGNSGDSAVAILSGTTTSIPVSAYAVYDYPSCYYLAYQSYCLSYARLTFVYDRTRIDSIAVQPVADGFATLSSSSGVGTFTVTASGVAVGYQPILFLLRVRLAAGAHDGGYLWAQVDSLASPSYGNLATAQGGARTQPAQVCHATNVWGDVDGNGGVDSRDALITLSAAVGLPVSGFSLAFGDVDNDGLTNSRDALMMLSSSIALPIYPWNRVGVAIPDACPGLTAPGETIVFVRSQASGYSGGIFRLDSLSTVPVQLTTDIADRFPRLNAAGTTVAFECQDQGYAQACIVGVGGASRRVLTGPGLPSHDFPDWSPDGTRFAYGHQNGAPPVLYTMDSSGANQAQVGTVPREVYSVGWSHDGGRLAFMDGTGTVQTVTMDTTHLWVSLGVYSATLARWSPNDSLIAYLPGSYGPLWSVPSGGGTPRPLVTISGVREYDWSSAGIVFSMELPGQYKSLWMLKGGPSGILVRLTTAGTTEADHYPSFRRSP